MDGFPSVDALINGSKSPVGITSDWDVVVSYALSPLDAVLQRLWTTSITSTAIQIVTESYNEDDEKYYTQWWLRLGAPTLQFTSEGKASLCMPLDGRRQVMGKDEEGNDKPVHEIPKDTYALFAVVPLSAVSANSVIGSEYTVKGTAGQVISFDNDPNSSLHIVFDFETKQAEGAVYTVGYAPNQPPPSSSVPDNFSVGLRDKLAAWIADPKNVSAIEYALAVVNQNPVPEAAYLTPQSISFSVYSNDTNPDVASLSIYMQTQDSGFQSGNTVRSFTLPASNNSNSYPIPSGYTASIIIRHDVFAQKFLCDTMLQFKQGEEKIFRSVQSQPTMEGFALTAHIESKAVADLGSATWSIGGGFSVDHVDWDFGAQDLTLKIKDSKCAWGYYFKPQVGWSQGHITGDGTTLSGSYGETNYEMKLDKSDLPLFNDASDVGLEARIGIEAGYWQTNTSAWDPGFWDLLKGASSSIPRQIDTGLQKINLPTFSGNLCLEYFATTNVFAPGRHMLSVSGSSSVYTPYDVIILGNVLDTVATNPPSVCAMGMSNLASMSLMEASIASKNTADLINDLALGRPILRQLTAVAQSPDGAAIQNVLQANGYSINDSDVSSALEAADAGPAFDVRFASGLYSFSEPADLKDTRMTIDPATGRIFIGKTRVNNSTDADGNVTWALSPYTYSVTFKTPFNSKGSADPITFNGTRTSNSGVSETVSGEQVKPEDTSDFFTNTPAGLTAGWIASVFGAGFSIYLWAAQKLQERRQQAAREAIGSAAKNARSIADDQAARSSASVPQDTVENVLFNFHARVEDEIKALKFDDPDTNPEEEASDAAKRQITSLVSDAVKIHVMATLAPFVNLIGPEPVNQAIEALANNLIAEGNTLKHFEPNSPYIEDVVKSQKARIAADEARSFEQSKIQAANEAEAKLMELQDDLEAKNVQLVERREALDRENKSEADIEADEEVVDLKKAIEDREKSVDEASKDYEAVSEERNEAERKRGEIEDEERSANEMAEASARSAFGLEH